MVLDLFDRIYGYKDEIPNELTLGMGKLIRDARNELKITQSELAEKAHLRQATISDLEKGKREASSSDLLYLSMALKKPVVYFFPKSLANIIDNNTLSPVEQELIMSARYLSDIDQNKIIAQIKAIINL
jgi:transcriptional regulator with XRE-family HTH domain